jgi:hypothetical protein
MFLVKFCCANTREEPKPKFAIDPETNSQVEAKLVTFKAVLAQYKKLERSMGMQEVDILNMQDKVITTFG